MIENPVINQLFIRPCLNRLEKVGCVPLEKHMTGQKQSLLPHFQVLALDPVAVGTGFARGFRANGLWSNLIDWVRVANRSMEVRTACTMPTCYETSGAKAHL
jgi:hypothetical protein